MNNLKIKTKRKDDHLTLTENSLAFRAASKLEQSSLTINTLDKLTCIWAACGQSVAKVTKTEGGLYISVVGHRSDFKDNPFSGEEGKLSTVYKLRYDLV